MRERPDAGRCRSIGVDRERSYFGKALSGVVRKKRRSWARKVICPPVYALERQAISLLVSLLITFLRLQFLA